MKNSLIAIFFMTVGILGGTAIGHAWGYLGMYLDEFEVDRSITTSHRSWK